MNLYDPNADLPNESACFDVREKLLRDIPLTNDDRDILLLALDRIETDRPTLYRGRRSWINGKLSSASKASTSSEDTTDC